MDFDKLYPSRFLKAGEFAGRDVTLTVSAVRLEELEGQKGKQMKAIVSFSETKKELVLNRTNGLCIRAMFGRETDAWVGKRVTLYPAPIDFGDTNIAIRVRGSPDLPAPLAFELKLPKKKPAQVTLQKTATAQPKQAARGKTKPTPTPPHHPTTGEVTSTGEPPPDVVLPTAGPQEPPPPGDADAPF